MKDGIELQFLWYFEIRKQHSNVVRLLLVYIPNLFNWHSNVWDLIDPLKRHANSYKQIETTGRYKKTLACIRIPLNDHTNPQNNDWYQIAQRITYVNPTFICCPIWCLCDVVESPNVIWSGFVWCYIHESSIIIRIFDVNYGSCWTFLLVIVC